MERSKRVPEIVRVGSPVNAKQREVAHWDEKCPMFSFGKSQRDFVLQPKVGARRQPWVNAHRCGSTPTGLWPFGHPGSQPSGPLKHIVVHTARRQWIRDATPLELAMGARIYPGLTRPLEGTIFGIENPCRWYRSGRSAPS